MATAHTPEPARPVKSAARPDLSRLVLLIDRATYVVFPLPAGIDEARRAYRLVKGDGLVYDLTESAYGPLCDCPDFIFRRDGLDRAGCKHIRALVSHGVIDGG